MEYCEKGDMAQLIKKCKADHDFVANAGVVEIGKGREQVAKH